MTEVIKELTDDRLRNPGASELRENRAMNDRAISENREISDAERIEMFRMRHFQNVLPDLPKIPGYHVCWLSTTSQMDTIHRRQLLGYEPLRREDVPGWNFDQTSLMTGETAGQIGINEMRAYKIRDSLYQAYMKEAHHDSANALEGKLSSDIEQIKAQAKNHKSYVEMFEGNEEVEENAARRATVFE
jgi:hypothetical protein